MQTASRLVSRHRTPAFAHLYLKRSSLILRNMSSGAVNLTSATTPSVKHKFVVWAPDQADALLRRLKVREAHLKGAGKLREEGILCMCMVSLPILAELSLEIVYGGATLTPESVAAIQPSEKKMTGSMLVIEADSIDVVREIVEKDVYYVNGVVRSRLRSCQSLQLIAFASGIRRR